MYTSFKYNLFKINFDSFDIGLEYYYIPIYTYFIIYLVVFTNKYEAYFLYLCIG